MNISVTTALAVARSLLELADAAEKDGKTEVQFVSVLQGVDDIARADLQSAIDTAKAAEAAGHTEA